jgi:16S rRNA processing protein RimM
MKSDEAAGSPENKLFEQRVSFLSDWRDTDKWISVGKVTAAHGLKGDIVVLLFAGEAGWLAKLKKEVYFVLGGLENPSAQVFQLQGIGKHKQGLRMSLDGIDSRNASEALKGALLFIPADFLRSKKGEDIFLGEVLGFTIIDEERGVIGEVESFASNGAQDLLCVRWQDQIWEVPFVPAFVREINFENRILQMSIPWGLLEELP